MRARRARLHSSSCTPRRYSAEQAPANPLTHYVIVRADLDRGIQSANVVHAAGESSPGDLPSGTHAICLTVPNEAELRAIAARLTFARVPFVPIVETDAPHAGELMAIGCVPARKEDLKRHLSSLPLLR